MHRNTDALFNKKVNKEFVTKSETEKIMCTIMCHHQNSGYDR